MRVLHDQSILHKRTGQALECLPCTVGARLGCEFNRSRDACAALSGTGTQDDCAAESMPAQISRKGRRTHPVCSSGGQSIACIRFIAAISICKVLRMQSTGGCGHCILHDHGNGREACPARVLQLDIHPPADTRAAFKPSIRCYVTNGSRSCRCKCRCRRWRRREDRQHIGVSCQCGILSP